MASAGIMKVDDQPRLQPVPLLDLKAQYGAIREELRAAIDSVADSQHFILGPEVEALETEIADYSQCAFAIGVSSGSDALLVALMAIDLSPGACQANSSLPKYDCDEPVATTNVS